MCLAGRQVWSVGGMGWDGMFICLFVVYVCMSCVKKKNTNEEGGIIEMFCSLLVNYL